MTTASLPTPSRSRWLWSRAPTTFPARWTCGRGVPSRRRLGICALVVTRGWANRSTPVPLSFTISIVRASRKTLFCRVWRAASSLAVAATGALSVLICLSACRSTSSGGGSSTCKPVVLTADSGTCPVMPAGGALCDLSDVPSEWCESPDCPSSVGCCAYGTHGGETCFPTCGACGQVPRQVACVAEGSCTTNADCRGSLPHICQSCPLTPDGQGSQGCAHWVCKAGQCEVAYCAPGLVCSGGQGCPAYYLPPVEQSCSVDADCALVAFPQTCCTTVEVAVRATEQQHFADLERQCASIEEPYACGCLPATVSEDGTSPGPGQSFAAACVSGTCKATITGGLQCGTTTCDPGQSCCVSPGDGGVCVYSCSASCPVLLNDAGAVAACRP